MFRLPMTKGALEDTKAQEPSPGVGEGELVKVGVIVAVGVTVEVGVSARSTAQGARTRAKKSRERFRGDP